MSDNPYLTSLLGGKKPASSSSFDDDTETRLHKYSEKHGVDPDLVRRLVRQESSGNRRAVSPKGASGLMQLMPATAKSLGVKNIFDPDENIDGGVRYLRQQLDEFGDVSLALAAYNAGPAAVRKYGRKVPPYRETQDYVKKIGSGYAGTGYHANAKREQPPSVENAENLAANPYFQSLTNHSVPADSVSGDTLPADTLPGEVRTSARAENSNYSNDNNEQNTSLVPPPVNLQLEKTAQHPEATAPGPQVKLPNSVTEPGAPVGTAQMSGGGDGSQNPQSATFRVNVKEGMQPIDVLREGLTQKGRAAGFDDKRSRQFANDALAELVRAGKNPGLSDDGQSDLAPERLQDLYKHGYADLSIADPAYDQLLQKHQEELRAEQAEKQIKQYKAREAENQTLREIAKSTTIARDLQWHFGINDPNDFLRLPKQKQRKILLLTSQAVSEDEKKKVAGQQIEPSLEYQNIMRQRVGLGENPALIDPRVPRSRPTKFSIGNETVEELLNIPSTESFMPGYDPKTGKVDVRPPAQPPAVDQSKLYAEVKQAVISEHGGLENVERVKRDYAAVGRDPNTIDQQIEQQTQARVADFEQRLKRVQLAESGGRGKLSAWDKIRELGDNPTQLLPFISSSADIAQVLRLGAAARKLENLDKQELGQNVYQAGGLPTEEDLLLLREFDAQNKADSTFTYKVLNVVSALPAFVGEFAATSGIYTGAKKAALEGIEKLVTKQGMKRLELSLAGRVATQSAAGLVGAAAQTIPSGATRIPAGVLWRQKKDGDDFAEALAGAVADQFIEVASERAGGLLQFIPVPKRLAAIRDAITARWLAKSPSRTLPQLQKIVERTGWHGVLGEMFEERFGDAARYAIGEQESPIPTLEQLAIEGVAFSIPGAVNAGLGAALSTSEQNNVQDLTTANAPVANASTENEPDTTAENVTPPVSDTRFAGMTDQQLKELIGARPKKGNSKTKRQEIAEQQSAAQAELERRLQQPTQVEEKPDALPQVQPDVPASDVPANSVRETQPQAKPADWLDLTPEEQAQVDRQLTAEHEPNKYSELLRGVPHPGGPYKNENADASKLPTPETQAESPTAQNRPLGVLESVEQSAAGTKEIPTKPAVDAVTENSDTVAGSKNKPGTKHEFSSTQVNLPNEIAAEVKRLAFRIPDKDLGKEGREDNPHATVKFGLHTASAEEVRPLIENEPPIKVKIGKLSTFPPSDSSGGNEVLKFDIDSKDLHRLNKKLSEALPHTDTFKYSPHITLAYVKPGVAQKYVGKKHPLQGKTITIDKLTFSGKNGDLVDIQLKGNADVARLETEVDALDKRLANELSTLERRLESGHLDQAEFERRSARLKEGHTKERTALSARRQALTGKQQSKTEEEGSPVQVVRESKKTSRRFNPETMDLSQAVRALGGIRVDRGGYNSGELTRVSPRELGTTGLVNNKSGMTAEQVAMALAQEGYRGEWVTVGTSNDGKETLDVDPNKFLEALENDASGVSKTYSHQREVDWEAEFKKQYDDDPDQQAVDSILSDPRASELFDLVESGRANGHEISEFREAAEAHGLSPRAIDFILTNAAARADESAAANLPGAVQSEGTRAEAKPAPAGTPLDPNYVYDDDGNILFHRAEQLGFIDDGLTPEAADHGNHSRANLPQLKRFPEEIYGDNAGALTRLAESPAPEVRYIAELLGRRAPHIAGAGGDVQVGITNLAIALTKLDYLRRTGTPVIDYLQQGSLFGEQLDSMQLTMLEAFDARRRDHDALAQMVDTYLRELKQGEAQFLPAAESESGMLFHRAFHGTPHRFDKFSTEKIGAGEGAQAYGWGLYFADRKKVAEYYKQQLAPGRGNAPQDIAARIYESLPERFSEAQKIEATIKELEQRKADANPTSQAFLFLIDEAIKAVQTGKHKGRVYEVELAPTADEYLLWGTPLSEQSDKVRRAVHALKESTEAVRREFYQGRWEELSGSSLYRALSIANGKSREFSDGLTAWSADIPDDRAASRQLHSIGVRGIKYLDEGSRNYDIKGELPPPTYNYVIFDENDVRIEAQYAKGWDTAETSTEETSTGDNLAEILPDVEVVQEGHRIQLNPAAHRLLIHAVNEMLQSENALPNDRHVLNFSGAFFNRRTTRRVERTLLNIAHAHPAREQLQGAMRLTNAFRRASGTDGTVIVYTGRKDTTLIHEGFHRASYLQSNRSFVQRHARYTELVESPAFAKAAKTLIAQGYDAKAPGLLVEEIAAYLWTGERERLGLTQDEALDYLELWFKSYTEKNGSQTRQEFEREREEAQRIIEASRNHQRRRDAGRIPQEGSPRPAGAARENRAGEEGPLFERDPAEVELDDLFHERGDGGGLLVKPKTGQALEAELFDVDAIKKRLALPDGHKVNIDAFPPERKSSRTFLVKLDDLLPPNASEIGENRADTSVIIRIETGDGKRDLEAEAKLARELAPRFEEPPVDLGDVETKRLEEPSAAAKFAREQTGLRDLAEALKEQGFEEGEESPRNPEASRYDRIRDQVKAEHPDWKTKQVVEEVERRLEEEEGIQDLGDDVLFETDDSRAVELRRRAFKSLVQAKQNTAEPKSKTKPGAYVSKAAPHKTASKAAPVPAAPPAPPPPSTPSSGVTDEELLKEVDRILADPQAKSYFNRIAEFGKKLPRELQRTFTSEFTPLKVGEIQLRGKQRLDLAAKAELLPGASGKAEIDLVRFQTRVVAPIAKLHSDFNKYVLLKRVIDRLTHDANRKRVADWTIEKAEQALNAVKKKIGDVNWKRIEKAGQAFQEEADRALQLRVDAGLISQKTYEAIKGSTDFYAPFVVMKHVVEGIPTEGGGRRIPNTQDLIDRITGIHDEDFQLQDFVLSAAQQIYQTRILAEKNLFMRDDFAPLADVDAKGELVRRVKLTRHYRVEFKPAEDILSQLSHQTQPLEQSFIKVGRAIQLAEEAGLTVRRKDMAGALGRATLGGMESNGKVLLRAFTSEVIAHELGHAADVAQKDSAGNPIFKSRKVFGTRRDVMQRVSSDINSKRSFQKELKKLVEFTKLGGDEKYRSSAKERFAEFMSLYIHNPKQARTVAPTWTDHFELNLLTVPEVKKLINNLSDFFQKVDKLPNIKTPLKEMNHHNYLETAIMRAFPNRGPIIGVQPGERGLHDVAKPGYKIVKYLDEGTVKGLEVRNDLAKALEGLHRGEGTLISRGLMIMAQPFRLGATTLNLAFQPVNLLFADLPRAAIMSRYGVRRPEDLVRFPADWIHSFYSALLGNFGYRNQLYEEFMKSGAYNSNMQRELTPEAFKPAMGVGKANLVKQGVGVPLKIASAFEETSKILGIKRGKRFENVDKLPADQQAEKMREIASEVRRYSGSPDFWRKGVASTGRTLDNLNLWFMFINARIQGTSADLSRLAGLAGGAQPAASAWLRLAIAVGVPTLTLALHNLDDDEVKLQGPEGEWKTTNRESYNAIPEWERRGNFMIPRNTYFLNDRGERVRNYWRAPKREIVQLFSNTIEAAVEFADKREGARLKSFATDFLENLSPVGIAGKTPMERMESIVGSLNPAAKTPIELVFNRETFRHRNIVPDFIDGVKSSDLPPSEQYTRSTPEAFVRLGKALSISPMLLEHATRGFSAGLVTQFLPPKPQPGRSPILSYPMAGPVARRFVRSESTARQSDNEILDQAIKQGATNKIEANREAYRIYQTWKKKPEGKELEEYLEERAVDPSIGKEVLALKHDDDKNLTTDERAIRRLAIETGDRVRFLQTLLRDKTESERERLIEEWEEKGLATKSVIKQLEASEEELREMIDRNNEKRMNSNRRKISR